MFRLFREPQDWAETIGGGLTLLPYEAYRRDEPQVHAAWLDQHAQVKARCSLWWLDTPILKGRRVGTIGHYAAIDADGGMQLLERACQTLSRAGCDVAIGPMDGNTWRNYRFKLDRDGGHTFFFEPHHPADWLDHFTGAGFSLLSRYHSSVCNDLSVRDPRLQRAELRLITEGVRFRGLDRQRKEADLRAIHDLCGFAFRDAFLFHSMTYEAFGNQIRPLLQRIDARWVQIAERDHEIVGFAFGCPDFLQPFHGKQSDTAILKTLAVYPQRALAGLGMLLMQRFHDRALEQGFRRVIHALMHDQNRLIGHLSSRYSQPLRQYGLFSRDLR